MADEEIITHGGVPGHPTVAASVAETTEKQVGDRGVCTSAVASGTGATVAEFDVRKPRPAASSAYLRPTTPPCSVDSIKSSKDSRKTSIRYNSGNSRKSSNNNLSGSPGSSGVHAETCSVILIHRRGSSSNTRNCNSRSSSSNGAVNGTITARKCVGCAARGDGAPVASGTSRQKTSGSDTQFVASVCEIGLTPRFIGTISYACSNAAQSRADERALPTLHEVHQQQQYQQDEQGQQGAQCQQQQRHQQPDQQQPPHMPQQEPHEVQRHHHTPEEQQQRQHQLPLLAPLQNPQPHSKHQPVQQDSTQLLNPSRRDVFQSSTVSAETEQEKPPVPASQRPLQHTMEHVRDKSETQRHPQEQLQRTEPTELGLEPAQQILQHLPAQQAHQPQQQQIEQHMHPQQQISRVVQSEKQMRKCLQSQTHQFSCLEYVTIEFDPVSTTGSKCNSAQVLSAARVHGPASAAQNSGSVISSFESEECRERAVPPINAEKVSGPACSNQTRGTQQQHENMHQVSSAAPQCSTPPVRPPVGLNALPSPSVANAGATPLSRLAAASKRHLPPPCTAFPSTLPRCYLSSSGAYPKMTSIPMLNGDFSARTTYGGKTTVSPAAAAVLREAASAAAAAAAAATDAATLFKNTIPAGVSTGSTGNAAPGTTATGARALAFPATAAAGSGLSMSAPPADANTTEPLEVQQRETANHAAFEIAESHGMAGSHLLQEQQQQHQQRQQYQQDEHCDSRLNHAAGTECCRRTAERPPMPVNTGCLVRDHCSSRLSCSSSNRSSETSGDRRHAEELRMLPPTASRQSSGIQDVYAAVEGYVAVSGVDGVTLARSALARKTPIIDIARDLLPAKSSAVFKNAAQGGSTREVAAAVGHHALPHTTAPTLRVRKLTVATTAAGTDEEETPLAGGTATAAGQETASVAAASGAKGTAIAQIHAADASAATFTTTATSAVTQRAATAAAAAGEKLQLRRGQSGCSTAGGTRQFPGSLKEAHVGGPQPSLLATPGRQRHTKGFCGPLLQPLQLPESPRSSCTRGGSPVAGTASGEAALARDLSPTATPGTPQNRHQLQQLLLHRTPAPQDRPRRPAAAAAAGGVVVRTGGPVAMWGTGGTSTRAANPAAPDHASTAAAEHAAADAPNAVRDANAVVPVCSSAAGEVAVATGGAAAAAESATVGEAVGVHGKQQQEAGDTSANSSSGETLPTEEERQSGEAEVLKETMSTVDAATKSLAQTTAIIPVTTSATDKGQTDVKPPAGNIPDAAEHMAATEPEETHHQREHTVLQPQGIQTPQEASQGKGSAPRQQQLQQLEEREQRQSSKPEERQTVRNDSSQVLPQEPCYNETQQRPGHYSDGAQEQQLLLKPGYQNGPELMRDGQQVLQRARQATREIIADEQKLLSQRNNSGLPDEQIGCGTSTLPVSIPGSPELILSRLAVESRVAVAADAAPCSWSTTDEDQVDVQMLDEHGNPGGELDYVSGGKNWSCSRRKTTPRKNKKSRTKTFRISTEGSQSGSSDLGERSSTSWSGLCSTSSLRDSRNGDCAGDSGAETLYGSDADLIYFPFSQEQGILGPPFVDGGAAELAAEMYGTTPGRSSAVSAIWQVQAASGVDGAASSSANLSYVTPVTSAVLLQEPPFSGYGELQQQGEADNSAAVTECEALDAQKSGGLPQQRLPYVSADDRDVEDNLPVSAAAMAAADAAAHLKRPPSCVLSPTEDPMGHEDLEYAPAAAAQHADLPWAASAWDPTYRLNVDSHKAAGLRANQRGDTIFASQVQPTSEEVALPQLQEQVRLQQRPHLWQLHQQYEQRPHVKSRWNTATEAVAGAVGDADWQHDNANCSTFDVRQRGAATPGGPAMAAPVASAASAIATAAPQGLSHLRSSCPSGFAGIPAAQIATGAATQAHEQQVYHQVTPRASVGTDVAFFSRGSALAELCQQRGSQQHDFLAPEQGQFLKTERPVSQPTAPSLTAAVALHGKDGMPLPFAPRKPTTLAGLTQQHTLYQPTQQELQLLTGVGACHLKQATAADAAWSRSTVATDVAAAGGANVTTGNPSSVNAVQRADIPMTTLQGYTLGPQIQQPKQCQQVPPQRLQNLYQQQQQAQQLQPPQQHLRQSLSPLSSSRIQALSGAHVLEKLGQGDGSPAEVNANCGAALIAPPPRQEQAFGDDGFLATAAGEGDHHSFPVDHVILNSRLKRAAPGAAAAALAATAASGAATGTGTCSAGGAATAPAVSTALPARHQEEGEAFCPFRRTVEGRRPCGSASGNSSSGSAGGAEGNGEIIELAGEERLQSYVSNRSRLGLVRKRFLGGTTRLFGGVKTHAAAPATRHGKLTPSKSTIAPAPSAPHQSSQSDTSGGWERRTPAHTPTAGTPSAQSSPVAPTRQRLLGGIQRQVTGVEQQLQQPLSPSSQHALLSQQHIPRASQSHHLAELTKALSPVLVQQYVQLWPEEQQQLQHQLRDNSLWQGAKCARSPSLPPELLQRERVPSMHQYPSAGPGVPRRRYSYSSTFLCETIPGRNNYVTIAPVGRGGQRGSSRSRRKTPPRLPCVAGRLLLAGGRVVGEVGQAAVDVGSTMVKELANVLQRSLENIVDKEGNTSCESSCDEYQPTCSSSLCMPLTCAKAGLGGPNSSHLLRQKRLTHSADAAMCAVRPRHHLCRLTEEQLQHNLWLQHARHGEFQEQQRTAVEVPQQPQVGEWQHPQGLGQQPDWRGSQSRPESLEEHEQRELLEQRYLKDKAPVKAWGIATEERLGGLWLPKVDSQHILSSQSEVHSAVRLSADQQKAPLQQSEHEASQHQQLNWNRENLIQHNEDGEKRDDTGCQQLQHQVHSVKTSRDKYAEFPGIARQHPGVDLSMKEDMPDTSISPHRQAGQQPALQHRSHDSQEADPSHREGLPQKREPLERHAPSDGIPAFPISLRWSDCAPQTPESHIHLHSKQTLPTDAWRIRKSLEQQEVRDRLVRRAAPVASLQSSDRRTCPRMLHSSSWLDQPCTHVFSCWNRAYEPALQQTPFQQETSTSSAADTSSSAFLEQHRSGRGDAGPSCSASSAEGSLGDSSSGNLFQTDKEQSATEVRETRKGTSTFGRPELMREFAGDHSMLLCYSDDGSNCSTVHTSREEDCGRRGISVETLSPRVSGPRGMYKRDVLSSASTRDENHRGRVPLRHVQQQDESLEQKDEISASEVRGGQQQEETEQPEVPTHNKRSNTPLHIQVRPQQHPRLSLQVQAIPSVEQPLIRPSTRFPLPPSRAVQTKQEGFFSMRCGAAMQHSEGMHAKLEACDRIVQRWKDRATKTVAGNLGTGTRRGI